MPHVRHCPSSPWRLPLGALALLLTAAAQGQEPPPPPVPVATPPAVADVVTAPDVPEAGSIEAIRRFTTAEEFLPESVSYVPDSTAVPSPEEVLGHLVGAPGELSRVADVHGYFRRLAAASDRVQVEVIGSSEEGREILLAAISSPENLSRLDRLRQITARLADPRLTPRAEVDGLVAEGRPFYYLLGGLHSAETGSPEMLMELAYRLAVSERPEIQRIRDGAVVLITPVVEPDGRDRMVDWYYRHLRGRGLPWEELSEILSPPYWGHYVFHDNNRDGMQLTQALSRAIDETYFRFHPQVMHDLHESVPLLYISTGHGPYSRAVDPVTINEWTQLAHHEAGELEAMGLPGVWTWGFWDGWWPGYLVSVANNHNGTGRFYETFGNGSADTFERHLDKQKFAGKAVVDTTWYRPWPPGKTLTWSLRDNTNYMEAGVLEALEYASLHGSELLRNGWAKAERALEKGRTEAPYAWVFPQQQRDPARLAYLVDQLRAQRIEVHRLGEDLTLGGETHAAGSYVVRLDQPYRNAALNFLEVQHFPADEPNPPYDDVAWTWPLLYGVEGERIDDPAILDAPMEPVGENVAARGEVEGLGEEVFLLADTGQTSLLTARVLLADSQVDAAEAPFEASGVSYPPGSWIVQAPRVVVEQVAGELGLTFRAAPAIPDVPRHVVDLPRLGVLHTWTSTQDSGWTRYTLERARFPYTLLAPDDLRRGHLGDRFDVILFPNTRGDLARIVHGIDPALGPLAYTRTAEYPSHGVPDASPDITGGMGFEGLLALERFVEGGGVLVTLANAGTLAVDGGLVRHVSRAARVATPGSELRARVLDLRNPIAYGYRERTAVFRGNGPLWEVPDRLRRKLVVVQFGTEEVAAEEAGAAAPAPAAPPIVEEDLPPEALEPSAPSEESSAAPPEETTTPDAAPVASAPAPHADDGGPAPASEPLVLSGFVKETDKVDGKPAILDVPVGRGRIVLFAFDPLHRYLDLSDFRFVWNVLLNWNDLPQAP